MGRSDEVGRNAHTHTHTHRHFCGKHLGQTVLHGTCLLRLNLNINKQLFFENYLLVKCMMGELLNKYTIIVNRSQ